jgi:CHAT domain-containing protein/tetratricopeptide (TPR) repeat protein
MKLRENVEVSMKTSQIACLIFIGAVSAILVDSAGTTHAGLPYQESLSTQNLSIQAQAERLNSEAKDSIQRGDIQGAIDKFNQALTLYRQIGDQAGEGKMLYNLGLAYSSKGEHQQALDYFNQALPILRAAASQNTEVKLLVTNTLVNIGLVYKELGEPQRTLEYYQQALPLLRAEGNHYREGLILQGIGSIYQSIKEYRQALAYFDRALPLFRAEQDKPNEAITLEFIALTYDLLGENRKAVDNYKLALPLWQAVGDRTRAARVLGLMGGVWQNLGEPKQALDSYNQALKIWQALKEPAEEANILNRIGLFYASLDDRKALYYYDRAFSIWKALNAPAQQADILTNIGLVYAWASDYPKALDYYKQALPLWQTATNQTGEVKTLGYIASAYFWSDNYQQTLASLDQTLPIWKALNNPLEEAHTHRRLGLVYSLLGQKQKALDHLSQAILLAQTIEQPRHKALLFSGIANVYNSLGNYQQALVYLDQALRFYQDREDREGEATTFFSIGFAHESQGNLQQALDFYQQSIKVQEQVRTAARLEELKTSFSAKATDAYQRAILLLMRLGQPTEAFELSERARTRTFLDQIGNARLDIRKGADTQLIQEEQTLRAELSLLKRQLEQENSKPNAQRSEEVIRALTTKLTTRQTDYEDLLVRLKSSNPEYTSLVSVNPLKLSEVQQQLDADTTLVSYFITSDKTIAFIVGRGLFKAVELPVGEKDLRAVIDNFRLFANRDDPYPDTLQQLYQWLIFPLKPYLTTPKLGIIPSGNLHYLPFAALTDGKQYLSDEYALFTLPSASTLRFIQQKRKPKTETLLALGDPAITAPLGILEYAQQEVEAIANMYGTQPFLGEKATETVVRSQAGRNGILHLAVHGKYNPNSPLFSTLYLAGDAENDGHLDVQEIYELDLTQATNLVVLSACNTQKGKLITGEEVVGMTRAFLYAGTPTVIASLWSANDLTAGFLMERFYAHLREGMDKAEALRQAQREVRIEYPHPYYWAAFVLTGHPGK